MTHLIDPLKVLDYDIWITHDFKNYHTFAFVNTIKYKNLRWSKPQFVVTTDTQNEHTEMVYTYFIEAT